MYQLKFSKYIDCALQSRQHIILVNSFPEDFDFFPDEIVEFFSVKGYDWNNHGKKIDDCNLSEIRKRIINEKPSELALTSLQDFPISILENYPLNQTQFWVFTNNMNQLVKYNDFKGQFPVFFPHEIPPTDQFDAVLKSARDMRAKYRVHSNLLGDDDTHRVIEFLDAHTISHRKYNIPCQDLQKAYKQFMMSIGEYVPYLETKHFISTHFLPGIEGILDADLRAKLKVSKLQVAGVRKPHYFGLTLNSEGHLFLV